MRYATICLLGLAAIASAGPAPAQAQVLLGLEQVLFVGAGGTPTANCQGFRDALASITDNSTSKRYLVRLAPGDYDCGNAPVLILEGIAVEGAGLNMTKITSTVDSSAVGVIHLQGFFTALRSLHVINNKAAPSQDSIAISIWQIFGSSLISNIELRDIRAQSVSGNYSLFASYSDVRVWTSEFFSPIYSDASIRLFFSVIPSFSGPGSAFCYSSINSTGTPWPLACL